MNDPERIGDQLALDDCEVEPADAPITRDCQLRELPGDTWHDIFEDAA